MAKVYGVNVENTLHTQIHVKADSYDEALEKTRELIAAKKIELTMDDSIGIHCTESGEEQNIEEWQELNQDVKFFE